MPQRTGMLAILSILAAIISYIATFTAHPFWGILLALLAIPLGIGGLVSAASPRVSGGIISIFAIVLGVIGLGVGALGVAGVIIF